MPFLLSKTDLLTLFVDKNHFFCKKFGIRLKTKKNTANQKVYGAIFYGGDKRDRTADLLNAIQALSQLSYTPKCCCFFESNSIIANNFEKCKNFFLYFLSYKSAGSTEFMYPIIF